MNDEKLATSNGMAGGSADRASTWANVRRLVARELRVTWPSYLTTGAAVLLLGLIASSFWIDGIPDDRDDILILDLFFVLITTTFALNWASAAYTYPWRDPFSGRLAFLRSLPIEVREIVVGRALTMVLSVVVMSLLFFLPQYLFPGALGAQAGPLQTLWFAGFWAGYSLLFGGGLLYMELGFRGKTIFVVETALAILLGLVVGFLDASFGPRIVPAVLGLSQDYGPLPAGVALLVGGTGFALFAAATTRRLGKRDLTL